MTINWITKLDDSNTPAYYYATLPGAMAYIMPGLDGTADAYINLDNGVRITAPRTFVSVGAAKRWVKRQTVSNPYVQYADVLAEIVGGEAQP